MSEVTLRSRIRLLVEEWDTEPDIVTAEYTLVQIAQLVGLKIGPNEDAQP